MSACPHTGDPEECTCHPGCGCDDDLDIGWSALNYVRAQDKANPDRICAWCFQPRSSDECQFAAKHPTYEEMFK